MFEQTCIVVYKFRFIVGAAAIVACLSLLSLLPPAPTPISAATPSASKKADSTPRSTYAYDGPNVVTAGMEAGLDSLGKAVDSAGTRSADILDATVYGIHNGLRSTGVNTVHGIRVVAGTAAKSALFAARTVGACGGFIAHGMIDGVSFVARTSGNIVGYFTNTSAVSALIRPADNYQVPVINSKTVAAASIDRAAAPQMRAVSNAPAAQAGHKSQSDAAWPVNGRVTTFFGVPHWPYQPTHTGIDISTGQRSGVTPILPFKAGRVIETVYSNYGLGNHVIVDHGEGISSVYAHLASISVKSGQEVDRSTTLGFEGTTGMSTGTHLHFEIRLNGQPVNPKHYLSGHP